MTTRRQPKGTTTGGQFAPSQNPESNVALDDHEWNSATKVFDGITYHVEREEHGDLVSYSLRDSRFGGGWNFTYDRTSRQARAFPRRPPPSKMSGPATILWRQRGEADIRSVVAALEPASTSVTVDGQIMSIIGSADVGTSIPDTAKGRP